MVVLHVSVTLFDIRVPVLLDVLHFCATIICWPGLSLNQDRTGQQAKQEILLTLMLVNCNSDETSMLHMMCHVSPGIPEIWHQPVIKHYQRRVQTCLGNVLFPSDNRPVWCCNEQSKSHHWNWLVFSNAVSHHWSLNLYVI